MAKAKCDGRNKTGGIAGHATTPAQVKREGAIGREV